MSEMKKRYPSPTVLAFFPLPPQEIRGLDGMMNGAGRCENGACNHQVSHLQPLPPSTPLPASIPSLIRRRCGVDLERALGARATCTRGSACNYQ